MLKIPPSLYRAEHALFAPSSAYRWTRCAASIGLSIPMLLEGEAETTWQAEEGTAAHWVLEQALREDVEADEFLGMEAPNGWTVDDEMVAEVNWSLDWIDSELADGDLYPESSLPIYRNLGIKQPIIYGTADIQHFGREVYTIADFKYGRWNVPVKRNEQLELYAIGAIDQIKGHYEVIDIAVIQPRPRHEVKVARYSVDEILALRTKYRQAIIKALQDNAPASPSYRNCMFCPAKMTCPHEYRKAQADQGLEELFAL